MTRKNQSRNVIWLVFRREFLAQVRTKSFVVGTLVTVAIIVGALVAFSIFRGDGEAEPSQIALTGDAPQLAQVIGETATAMEVPVEVEEAASDEEARALVESGDVEAALLANADGSYTIVSDDEPDPMLRTILETAVSALALDQALGAQGVDAAALQNAVDTAQVSVETIAQPDPERGERIIMSWVALYLLFGTVMGYGMYVAMGVTEEKSSRIVELLLSTIRPLQLLWGKILGIGAVALLSVVTYGVVGIVAAQLLGLLTVTTTALSVFAATVIWVVLGFVFFATLYAAAGSLVSRQEEMQQAASPLMIILMACFGISIPAIFNPEGTLSNVLAWIPPFSAFVMPVRTAAGVTSPLELAGSIAVMVIACLVASILAARIYQRTVLTTGSRISWVKALRG
ncbi:ABC transporter permease [Hoyosella subflava]|uniref:Putative ABC transporter permease protein n=1 Tax=Hoyosella subflava (strain DSM 45089 / JCM 17490 / NBRC 109087 / DQS3-9A1) TaxID=443218 RepID=F6ENT1_HOYSD|nr:ABC transporter permease [Hoyosella subflava]AEF42938.1 Putative ABC transporter permease protein [Hoyosella subflava DQS3-9A1]